MNFESELEKGNFVVPECKKCKKIVWPPSDFCNRCLREVSWRNYSNQGKIIEFSKQNNAYFCLAEFENPVKIMGKITHGIPDIGKYVKIKKCGIKEKDYYFEMSVE